MITRVWFCSSFSSPNSGFASIYHTTRNLVKNTKKIQEKGRDFDQNLVTIHTQKSKHLKSLLPIYCTLEYKYKQNDGTKVRDQVMLSIYLCINVYLYFNKIMTQFSPTIIAHVFIYLIL